MSNNNISAPKPDEQAMTGEEYNTLRQDLLNNHRHSGPNDGGPISHLDLADTGSYTHPQIDEHINSPYAHGAPPDSQLVYGADNTHKIFAPYEAGTFGDGDHWTHFACVKPRALRVGGWRVDDVIYRVSSTGHAFAPRYLTGPGGEASKLVRFDPPFEFPPLIFLQQSQGGKFIIHPYDIGVDGFSITITTIEGETGHTEDDPDWLMHFQFMWLAIEGTSGNWLDGLGRPHTWNEYLE